MTHFHAFTDLSNPGLHIWRESSSGPQLKLYLRPIASSDGWVTFRANLDSTNSRAIRFMFFEWKDATSAEQQNWEDSHFVRELPRVGAVWPGDVWFFQDTKRVCLQDPRGASLARVRIHLITASRYREGKIYLWHNAGGGETIVRSGEDASGPWWELNLAGWRQQFFNFKFMRPDQGDRKELWEGKQANRTWTALDGAEVWTHSEAAEIATSAPAKQNLRVHFHQEGTSLPAPVMRLWQDSSDFSTDIAGSADPARPGWLTFDHPIYTGLDYAARFHNPGSTGVREWENDPVRRAIKIAGSADLWALEGESVVFTAEPPLTSTVTLQVAQRTPDGRFGGPLFAHVWIDRARMPLHMRVPVDASGRVTFRTYAGATTSVRFHTDSGWENTIERHTISSDDAATGQPLHIVLERAAVLREAPPPGLFTDPPFEIARPGVYEEGGSLHFIIHAPKAARVRLWGEWLAAGAPLVDLLSTRDGTFWWARIPVASVEAALAGADYHGARYHFVIDNDRHMQDPAAGWVVSSAFDADSRLVQSDKHVWASDDWRRPTWDYLVVYQVHPSRFSARGPAELSALERIAWEIEDGAGYFRELGVTAVLLMPVNEFAGSSSWGYNPAFFYAVEGAYGGPDALKKLVDTCHRKGLAVILDVVFNHTGGDSPLWEVARETYFDGDTDWGALVNFDHPQCRHFFAKNLAYLAEEYRLDGFRLDFTQVIVHGHEWSAHIRSPGSGGGGAFLDACRAAVRRLPHGDRCLIMAEHLPNEWWWSREDRPLDTQWNDNFHDRGEEACRGWDVMPALANAFKITHTEGDHWHDSTNYFESHDEVGNENDRVANVAGMGRGLRMSKVAAAGTLLSRGIPMFFMGAESAEWRQFRQNSDDALPLDFYLGDDERKQVRRWWKALAEFRRDNPNFRGPAPLDVRYAQSQMLGFTRGQNGDYYVLLNFGGWSGHRSLAELNLPNAVYRECFNSSWWPAFINLGEGEGEHTNGGSDARLDRSHGLHIPDYGVVVLERV